MSDPAVRIQRLLRWFHIFKQFCLFHSGRDTVSGRKQRGTDIARDSSNGVDIKTEVIYYRYMVRTIQIGWELQTWERRKEKFENDEAAVFYLNKDILLFFL